ncbi:MAG: hypothetical protein RL151_618, partial [Bacteroidota bacterium]
MWGPLIALLVNFTATKAFLLMIQDIKDIVLRQRRFLLVAVALPTLTALVVSL